MCQYIIGGQKTLGFCYNQTEGALIFLIAYKNHTLFDNLKNTYD
jgi:hypothetical protein